MPIYTERFYRSRDGLQLYYRDYPGDPNTVPVLCLHGLTRNCRDFEALALRIAPGRRVITPDFRGRGRSQYDVLWMNYHPMTYVDDMWALLRDAGCDRVIAIGTSLGGLVVMLMAAVRAQTFAGVVLNDIGPEIDPSGAERIRGYAGRFPPPRTWDEAIEQTKVAFGAAFPDFTAAQWQTFVRLAYSEDSTGSPKLDVDPRVGDAVRAIQPLPGATQFMWSAFGALRNTPTLAIRGQLSDVLSVAIFDRMQREHPDLQRVTVPNRGHVPLLDEPQSLAALERLLASAKVTPLAERVQRASAAFDQKE
jgi:pimeloyl-ACP methyl ester carboxylesterase